MSHSQRPASLAEMMLDPYRYFPEPIDVARNSAMSKAEKLSVLRAMECDARELEVATEENMAGGEKRSLADVLDAVRAVDSDAAARRKQED